MKPTTRCRALAGALLAISALGCGTEKQPTDSGEHVLSGQQEALERSKAAAAAIEEAAAKRAEQSAPPE